MSMEAHPAVVQVQGTVVTIKYGDRMHQVYGVGCKPGICELKDCASPSWG